MNSAYNQVIISSYHKNGLFFSVGVSNLTGRIMRISLPKLDEKESINQITNYYPNFIVNKEYEDEARDISMIYFGKESDLDLNMLELRVDKSNDQLPVKSLFMRNVLIKTYNIPRGKVETYKSIAVKLKTRAYRAVGTALGRNPYPLLIPCHRVIKSDYSLGQYGGGDKMKKRILENEGLIIKNNKVVQ
jgi:methylated-DNA-[protein]-cysteine S-methyltransferase